MLTFQAMRVSAERTEALVPVDASFTRTLGRRSPGLAHVALCSVTCRVCFSCSTPDFLVTAHRRQDERILMLASLPHY